MRVGSQEQLTFVSYLAQQIEARRGEKFTNALLFGRARRSGSPGLISGLEYLGKAQKAHDEVLRLKPLARYWSKVLGESNHV